MKSSAYTLLIVESPVMASAIQQKAPSSVYVIATGGYCWRPSYDSKTNRLKPIADPQKVELRKELKEQARWAGNIIVATDPDPSGDFIAWSVDNYLKSSLLKRGQIRSISKSGIISTISETHEFNSDSLETRLKNQFIIRNEWKKVQALLKLQDAALTAFFSSAVPYNCFLNENGMEFRSSRSLRVPADEWIPVRIDESLQEYKTVKPLSTYDVIELIIKNEVSGSFTEAQLLIQQLFQTTLHTSDEALISYPRTDSNAFYSETWDTLRDQFISFSSQSELKPRFLQEIAGADEPHESIHPLNLKLTPDSVNGEMPEKTGQIYTDIYNHTMEAITLPKPIKNPLISDLSPDAYFYTISPENSPQTRSLRPFHTISDLGHHLKISAQISASGFGKQMDEWIDKEMLEVKGNQVLPGKNLIPLLKYSEDYLRIFNELLKLNPVSELSPETVRRILTS